MHKLLLTKSLKFLAQEICKTGKLNKTDKKNGPVKQNRQKTDKSNKTDKKTVRSNKTDKKYKTEGEQTQIVSSHPWKMKTACKPREEIR